MKTTNLALVITSILSSPLSFAENNTDELENIIVTANRTPQGEQDLLSSITVLTEEDIALSAASSLSELLKTINGIQISQSGGAGQSSSLFTRGTNAGHTLVIINGQRISSATLGQVDFSQLALEQIARIEVIKGPRAALWGSDALGGVIQIFTRQGEAGQLTAQLALGNRGQQQANLSTAFNHGDGSTSITVAAQSADGHDVFTLADADNDGYSRENISLVGQQNLNDQWQINWLAKANHGHSLFDSSSGGNENEFNNYQWQVSAQQSSNDNYQQLTLGQQKNKTIIYGNGIAKTAGNLFETQRIQANWLNNLQISTHFSASLGVDLLQEKVAGSNNNIKIDYTQHKRNNHAIYSHFSYNDNSYLIDFSVRYDDIENIKTNVTYNSSLGLRLNDDSLISLNLGKGFKAPSFNDLYYPSSIYSGSNPNLKAEFSTSAELLIKSQFANINSEISLFNTEIDDLIEWSADEDTRYTPKNVAKVKIQGVELDLALDSEHYYHKLSLSYLDSKNKTTGAALIRRAKHTANYQISRQWQQLQLQLAINYQGKRTDNLWPNIVVNLPSHTLVNLSASYQLNTAWQLGLKLNNVFNKHYQSNYLYTGQPVQYLLTLRYQGD